MSCLMTKFETISCKLFLNVLPEFKLEKPNVFTLDFAAREKNMLSRPVVWY